MALVDHATRHPRRISAVVQRQVGENAYPELALGTPHHEIARYQNSVVVTPAVVIVASARTGLVKFPMAAP